VWRAANVGALTPYDGRIARVMDPAHLLSKNYNAEAVRWYLASKLRNDPESTLRWFESSSPAIAAIFDRGTPREDVTLVGLLAAELAKMEKGRGVLPALKLLGTTTPEPHRLAVAETRGAREAALRIARSKDAAAVSAVLDWLIAVKPSYAGIAAANLDAGLPAEVRAKAKGIVEPPAP
jgi:hypothetical protein